ncbi:MAG: hypothetical protein WCJ30_17675 [Deltaproteobacteria bacterium]
MSESVPPPGVDAGWELVTAAGDRLTVRGALNGRDLATVITAIARRRR